MLIHIQRIFHVTLIGNVDTSTDTFHTSEEPEQKKKKGEGQRKEYKAEMNKSMQAQHAFRFYQDTKTHSLDSNKLLIIAKNIS